MNAPMKSTKIVFDIVPIFVRDKNTIIEFLLEYFFRDEPLNIAVDLMKDKSEIENCKNYVIQLLECGLAFKAVSPKGELMGVILSSLTCRDDNEENDESERDSGDNTKFKDITKLLEKVERETDVFTKFPNVNRIMDIKIISVDEAFRGQGVCKALIEKTKELALEKECPLVYVECSSYFSAKAAERLGFKCIYTLYFRDYTNENGEPIFKTLPPHDSSKVYVLSL